MQQDDILLLYGKHIKCLLDGRESAIVEAIRAAYIAHAQGDSDLPHSTFLRFPDQPRNRIIALPAFLGGGIQAAGVKWIASFPDNVNLGRDRASAVIILNSTRDGRPLAILEGSVISARRTAASAALAASAMCEREPETAGLIGCGVINHEIARFVLAAFPRLGRLLLYDHHMSRAHAFAEHASRLREGLRCEIKDSVEEVLANTSLTAFATTALSPYLSDLSMCPRRAVLLHVSLRDLTPEAILSSTNFVDDIEHICRAQTSVHLAEQRAGDRAFIHGTLADLLKHPLPNQISPDRPVVFSPFGLGVLDLALAHLTLQLASAQGVGTIIDSFFPSSVFPRTIQEPVSTEKCE